MPRSTVQIPRAKEPTPTDAAAPKCDNEGCACGGRAMELNGLRFTCSRGSILECHIDDFPQVSHAVNLLEAHKAVAEAAKNCAAYHSPNHPLNVALIRLAKLEKDME